MKTFLFVPSFMLLSVFYSWSAYTPSAFIYTELNLLPIYVHTLRIHFKFIRNVISMPNTRLPKKLALLAVKSNLTWYKDIKDRAAECGIVTSLDPEDSHQWKTTLDNLMKMEVTQFKNQQLLLVNRTSYSSVYRILEFNQTYFLNDSLPFTIVSWILKCRGDLLSLRCRVFSEVESECVLCGNGDNEDLFHFMAVCPRLGDVRRKYLGACVLEGEVISHFINGKDWLALGNYCMFASRHRRNLIEGNTVN